MVNSNKLN
jgi:acyl-coenzyme A thioesterase PaaI-like protein